MIKAKLFMHMQYHNRYNVLALICVLSLSVTLFAQNARAQVGSGDPCPTPKEAVGDTPNSMARVQEDIDRFILCVERAQLLNRLNTLVESNTETIDSVLLQPQILPPLPVEAEQSVVQDFNNTPGVAGNAPAPINEASLSDGMNSPMNFDGEGNMPGAMDDVDTAPVWLIREIYGASGRLQARLVNSEGALATVKQGDILDDESRIVEISTTSIKIRKDEEIIDLEWVNDNDQGEAR
jgi:type IV pilus biogenesis protein PilP